MHMINIYTFKGTRKMLSTHTYDLRIFYCFNYHTNDSFKRYTNDTLKHHDIINDISLVFSNWKIVGKLLSLTFIE